MSWRRHLAVLALFVAATCVVTYPLPTQLGDVLAGKGIDVYINPWADWWTHHVLDSPGESLYWTDYLFYPDGVSLVFHSFSHTNTAVSLALQPWLGQPAAYNITILLAYALSAFGMYLLVAYLTGSTAAGLVAGTVFAFSPYHISQSTHPVLVSVQWMPFTLLYLVRWLRERLWWQLVLAAVFFLFNALTSWHLMTFLSLWLVAYGVYYMATDRYHSVRGRVRGLAAFVVLGGAVILPFIWPLLREQLMTSRSLVTFTTGRPPGMDVRNLALPPWLVPGLRRDGYLGLVAVLLAGLGVWKRGRPAWLWFGTAVVSLLIAIGRVPRLGSEVFKWVALPWSRVFVPLVRTPVRFQVLVMFSLAGATGYGWSVVEGWLAQAKSTVLAPAVRAAGLLLLLLDYTHLPFPTTSPTISPFYEQLAQEPGDFAIAPFPADRQNSKYHLYYQTIHGKRIVAGHVSRTPVGATDFLEGDPFAHTLGEIVGGRWEIAGIWPGFDRLEESGVRYVVFHKDQVSREIADRVNSFLPLHPAYEDEILVAYRTDLRNGRDYTISEILTRGLGLLTARASPEDSVHQGTFLGLDLCWATSETLDRDLVLRIALVSPTGEAVQVSRLPIHPDKPTSQWTPDTLLVGAYRLRVGARVAPGQYELQVGVADPLTGEQVGDMAKVTSLEVLPLARNYDLPAPQVEALGCFGDCLCVLGYDAEHGDERLGLVVYWQANCLMGEDHVISTRLVDPSSGAFVCQKDAAPRDWTYPTTWWDAGEVVTDTAACDTSGLPPGSYNLQVAAYEAGSGEALTVSEAGAVQSESDQVLPLGKIELP